jgi:hypothetical protein
MKLDVDATPELEARLEELAPWMHPFQFGPETLVGYFKRPGLETTVVTSRSSPALRERFKATYDAYMATDPGYEVRELARRGTGRLLDIASATGGRSFSAHLAGFDVRGVEIRAEQVTQAQLVASLDARFRDVEFVHDAQSADHPDFRKGETYDVVMSGAKPRVLHVHRDRLRRQLCGTLSAASVGAGERS